MQALLPQGGLSGHTGQGLGPHLGQVFQQGGDQQRGLVGKMPEDGAQAHAGPVGDSPDGGALEALLLEERLGTFQEQLPGLGLLLYPAAVGGRGWLAAAGAGQGLSSKITNTIK